ncbi:DUF2946 family protein [Herbaspirillum sp. YR522]|uniref:DUF2946 family protein n=1 Tax=Herbaspirillum sp. YR522 TaxID=1144342 RepID=UPI00026FAB66|nr:DUF2946 family protein [Herbaspirillum sp. YR522]EJM97915.1 hypothetical protein PMI40_04190 [Herbaspirillum sp. YR522]
MILRAKILLLWLLALAIPVQGFAAVLQAGCAPATSMAAPAPGGHGVHGMHDSQAMQTMRDGQHHMVMADTDHPSSQHLTHKAGSSCSSCATCNVGAVLPLALAAPTAPHLPSQRYLPQPSPAFVGFTPENPDRPPARA